MKISHLIILLLLTFSCAHKDQLLNVQMEEDIIVEIALDETIGPVRDTAKLYVFLNDTLGQLPEQDKELISKISQSDNFSENFTDIDSSFRIMLLRLGEIKEKRYLDVRKLKSRFKYRIVASSNFTKYASDTAVGIVMISRVLFSPDNLKACVYTIMLCEGDCGSGQVILLEKKLDKWEVINTHLMWVS